MTRAFSRSRRGEFRVQGSKHGKEVGLAFGRQLLFLSEGSLDGSELGL